jgi:hypothetical protein
MEDRPNRSLQRYLGHFDRKTKLPDDGSGYRKNPNGSIDLIALGYLDSEVSFSVEFSAEGR